MESLTSPHGGTKHLRSSYALSGLLIEEAGWGDSSDETVGKH